MGFKVEESFNDWGGRGCRKFIPVLGDGTKIAPPGDIIDQPSSGMSWIRGKFADHVGDHVVLFPEGTVSVTSPGTESSCPRPLQSLNDSEVRGGGTFGMSSDRTHSQKGDMKWLSTRPNRLLSGKLGRV